MNIRIECRGEQLSSKPGSISRGIELAKETSVPSVYRILKDFLYFFEKPVFRLSSLRQADFHQLCELLRFVMFHERCTRTSA